MNLRLDSALPREIWSAGQTSEHMPGKIEGDIAAVEGDRVSSNTRVIKVLRQDVVARLTDRVGDGGDGGLSIACDGRQQ